MQRRLGISLGFRTGMALAVGGLAGGCTAADLERFFPRPAADAPADPKVRGVEPAAGTIVFPLPPTKPESRPRPDRMSPARLVGIDQDDATRILGSATSIRELPPATVWEYRTEGCAVDLFFYMDMQEKRFRVLAYDIKTSTGDRAEALENCLDRIRNMRRGS